MRSFRVKLALAAGAAIGSGCSLIYNPSNLPPAADAAPDAPMVEDVDPRLLTVSDIRPSVILEGTGAGGSRPAVIVINGDHMAKEGATIEIKPVAGTQGVVPALVIDAARLDVERNGNRLAVPVTVPVDTNFNGEVTFDVTVTQPTPDGPRSATLAGKLVVRGLPELTNVSSIMDSVTQYSEITLMQGAIPAVANAPNPIVLRSTSSVTIADAVTISVSASGQNAGPGGGKGGKGGIGLGGIGESGEGPAPGTSSGQPGGFDTVDIGLSTLGSPNRGSGGAGGDGAVAGNGGNGGGGGGSIEISAAGDLRVGAISAKGADGKEGNLGGGKGGGGSGGVILLRAGGALVAKNMDVSGGGNGKAGRARYDSGESPDVPDGPLGKDHFQGAMIAEAPLTTRVMRPTITVRGEPFSVYRYFVTGESGEIRGPFDGTIGEVTASFETERLEEGLNQICFVAPGATIASPTRNCFDIAVMFDPLQP